MASDTDTTSDDSPTLFDTVDAENGIVHGDAFDVLEEMPTNSCHAVVTDPPYGLAFMGADWDQFDPKEYQSWCQDWAEKALRVLKPGGHLIAFSGNRTHHRLFSGIEDAGFQIRDTLTWHQGEGFPKGSDISKHIDRYFDAEDEREVVGTGHSGKNRETWNDAIDNHEDFGGEYEITAPATEAAKEWEGWETQLKPATEFAVLARAPLATDAIYKNVLEYGTGALNVDRTRILTDDDLSADTSGGFGGGLFQNQNKANPCQNTITGFPTSDKEGRFPANLLLDVQAARILDAQSGTSVSTGGMNCGDPDIYGEYEGIYEETDPGYGDEGGASRFFKTVAPIRFKYCPKASTSERTINGQVENDHKTVKSLELMEWLVTLVSAPGQVVVDPFAGSGTTIMACRRLKRTGIGIEKDADHVETARQRVALAHEVETDFREQAYPGLAVSTPQQRHSSDQSDSGGDTEEDPPLEPDATAEPESDPEPVETGQPDLSEFVDG